MRMHGMMRGLLSALTALTLLAAAPLAANEKKDIYIVGTGSERGVYFPAGGAICRLLSTGYKRSHNYKCYAEATSGSIYNIAEIREGKLDFGITQSDWQYHALNGTSEFEKFGPYKELRSVFSLHSEPFTLVVRKESGIKSFDDLRGKRVNIVNPGSGSRATMEVLMKQKGWTTDVFRLTSELKATEQGQALCDNRIDAFVHATGHPNGLIQEVTANCDVALISISGPDIEKLLQQKPYYTHAVIPGGMYKGTDSDIRTFGIRAGLVTSAQTDPEVVYQLVKSVFENFENFQTRHPVFSTLKKHEMIASGNIAPLHEGARRYYREAGLIDQNGKIIIPEPPVSAPGRDDFISGSIDAN